MDLKSIGLLYVNPKNPMMQLKMQINGDDVQNHEKVDIGQGLYLLIPLIVGLDSKCI